VTKITQGQLSTYLKNLENQQSARPMKAFLEGTMPQSKLTSKSLHHISGQKCSKMWTNTQKAAFIVSKENHQIKNLHHWSLRQSLGDQTFASTQIYSSLWLLQKTKKKKLCFASQILSQEKLKSPIPTKKGRNSSWCNLQRMVLQIFSLPAQIRTKWR